MLRNVFKMEIENFKTIVLPLREKLFAVARKVLPDEDEAEDAVQEAMIRLWQAKETLLSHPNAGGYSMQTLKNICLDKIKQNRYHSPLDSLQIESNGDNPYQCLEKENSIEIIRHIINHLPELQRLTITMRDIEEYELSEIADITGSNIAAVKVNLSRARKKIRDSFLKIQEMKGNNYE